MEHLDQKLQNRSAKLPPRLPIPLPDYTLSQKSASVTYPVTLPPLPLSSSSPFVPPPPGSGHFTSQLAEERIATLIPEIAPISSSEMISRELSTRAVPFNTDIRRIIRKEAPARPVARFMKRMLDLFGSLFAIILLSPVFALLITLVKLDSRGPAFFSQTRVGKNGRLFKFYKFRSMVTDAERLKASLMAQNEADGPAFKMRNDPRVTRVGRFIRKTSLDELPQLWNVLKGDMSLVGPRPALPSEVEKWQSWQHGRLAVEQGCTCIWQVSGRSDVNFDQWMKMDIDYVRRWSLSLDIAIIFRTVLVMLTGKGAY